MAMGSRLRRGLLLGMGWLCVGLGIVGAVLPMVPTTPFMLLALWAFSSSSPRVHDWLYQHAWLGPPLQRWHRERVIPPRIKAVALVSMAASLAYVGLWRQPAWYVLVAMAVVCAGGAAFILSTPSRRVPVVEPMALAPVEPE